MQSLLCLQCSQPEKLKNAVPFATGIFWKLKPEVLVEWKAPQESDPVPPEPFVSHAKALPAKKIEKSRGTRMGLGKLG